MIEVSVIIPSRNSFTLERTLNSVLKNDYPRNKYEVIVADSSDHDFKYSFKKKLPAKFVRLQPPAKGRNMSLALNAGIKKARGKIIFFTDSHCIVPKNWISSILEHFSDDNVAAVGGGDENKGNIFDDYMNNSIASTSRKFKKIWFTTANNFDSSHLPIGVNLAIRKKIIKNIYFNEKIGFYEEFDVLWKIVEKNFKIVSIPNIDVTHSYNKNFIGILKTFFRYGRGCGYFCMKYPHTSFSRKRILLLISILVFYSATIFILDKFHSALGLLLIPTLLLYLYYIRLFPKTGLKFMLFPVFDSIFAGLSYIAGMIYSIILYPFKKI